ncbi:glycoside hydrolase family 32 protein [Luteolibacter yonseiensis]|uniref:Glycoside hydrolase family 32 protein n=1 Tax=Luteolibacter yonseiensis TaxID=1144680 RepID=A0A934VBT0_9BACT|nr:glycoside hydrolase family 32 protein [Luteolibacter yonseiensis]MBK1816261.1 glycoside hydrolase family 32 protein [Luteolibacter yonseiensis]
MTSLLKKKTRGAFILGALLLAVVGPGFVRAAGEPYRPQFHFTPERNWLNDPNGLVYYKGEYHLFFQYNPYGIGGAYKSWGHAVSRDLVRWEELPVAIPYADGIEIFSGSAVIDWNNTSGFGVDGEPPMVAIYTGAHGVQDQRIAYSNDRGRTFTNYSGNPVIDIGSNDFRDPKVFWHQPTGKWVMIVALSGLHKVRLYSSPNLKNWTQLSEFGPAGAGTGAWECPDLFQLPVQDEGGARKWVLTVGVNGAPSGGTGAQYFIGEFNGTTFVDDAAGDVPPLPAGTLIADFEGSNYGGWTTTGTAFGGGAVAGAFGNQNPVTGYRGAKCVNSYLGGDGSTGTLTSPAFALTKRYLNFLIGGGNHPGQTCVNLIVNGNVVRTATGADNERLNWTHWDVSQYAGMNATLRVVDSHTGGWGHVNVDHFLLSDDIVPSEADSTLWMDYGPDNYAAVSWSDIPEGDGRRLWIGWMVDLRYVGSIPTTPWLGGMTLPRELVLKRTSAGLRVAQRPVEELRSLRSTRFTHPSGSLAEVDAWLANQDVPKLFECIIELEVPVGESAGLRIGTTTENTKVTWNRATSSLAVDRTQSGNVGFNGSFPGVYSAPVHDAGDRLKLHLLVDAASLEVFSADGTTTLSNLIFPAAATKGLQLFGAPGTRVTAFDLWELGSIHPAKPDGLLGHWAFDEAVPGTYADSSGNGHIMSATGGLPAPAVVPGVRGNAAEIRRVEAGPQTTSLLVPAAGTLMPDSFTVSYHFNPKANDNAKLSQIRWETSAGLAWGFELLQDRKMNFYVFDARTANDVQSASALPFEAFNASGGTADNIDNDPTWHHVAASYDSLGGKLTLYLDGVKSEKAVTGLLGGPRYGSTGIGGGIRSGSGLTIYDDLRIYGRRLTDSEVAHLRLNPGVSLPEPEPDPVVPPSLRIERYGSSMIVSWPAGTGLALWQSTALDPGDWVKIPNSENLTSHATVTSEGNKMFFRLGPP